MGGRESLQNHHRHADYRPGGRSQGDRLRQYLRQRVRQLRRHLPSEHASKEFCLSFVEFRVFEVTQHVPLDGGSEARPLDNIRLARFTHRPDFQEHSPHQILLRLLWDHDAGGIPE